MLHTILASFVAIVVIVGGYTAITVIRDRMMGPAAPKVFGGCDQCVSDSDCSQCASRETCDQNRAS